MSRRYVCHLHGDACQRNPACDMERSKYKSDPIWSTHDPFKVTCNRCKKTAKFDEAMKQPLDK